MISIDMQLATHTFTSNFGQHTAQLSALLVDDVPWFRAKEAAAAMGYKNLNDAIAKHVDKDDKQSMENLRGRDSRPLTNPNEGACTYISESGLYSLIIGSKKPHAQAFKRWVMKEVLPSIRRTGSYRAPGVPSDNPALRNDARELEAVFLRLAGAKMAYELAKSTDSSSTERVRKECLRLVNEYMLPRDDSLEDYMDAADILRERDYSEAHIPRLAGSLGKLLKEQAVAEERTAQQYGRGVGPVEIGKEKQVALYHRVQEREFIERVLATFKERPLHARVLAGAPDPVALRKSRGRGRGRT